MSRLSEPVTPPTHGRILLIMAILGAIGSIAGAVFHSLAFGIGILTGTALAFVNYFWLQHSLRKVFANAAEGERPKVSALKYISRYLALAAVIAVIYVSGVLPVVPVILGMCAFGFAVVVDGIIRIFTGAEARTE
jgi:hypothetical protein